MTIIRGRAHKSSITKLLVQKLNKNDIAVIRHSAIDLVAAQDLKYKKVKAVINCDKTIDLSSSLEGTEYLIKNNIKLFDVYNAKFFSIIKDNDIITIIDNMIYINGILYTNCYPILMEDVISAQRKNDNDLVKKRSFIKNTMSYMDDELEYFIINNRILPILDVEIQGKEVLIISRGRYYRDDIKSIKKYILNKEPVLIGVDGGADAITDIGLKSDIIIGDMDSVSDISLKNCREILVHSYSSGYAPGLKRIVSMGYNYKLIQIKGTSEDAAVYLAKIKEAKKIYLLGSHTGIEEFMEKGRSGAGSTILLRMLTGVNVVDLKGISNIIRYNKNKSFKISLLLLFFISMITISLMYMDFEYVHTTLKILFDLK